MKEKTNAGSVYEDCSGYRIVQAVTMTENVYQKLNVRGYNWILRYNLGRESDSTLVKVSADFKSRYRFSDKANLEVTVKAVDKTITENFDLEKDNGQCFNVDLAKNGLSEVENDDFIVTCRVEISDIKYAAEFHGTWSIFTFSGRPHDVVLVVGEEKFYIQKASRYFNALFYGDFAEKDKKEIKIEDVDSTEFETLMKVIHPDMKTRIYDSNVLYLLKLADRFDMPSVMAMCGNHIMNFGKKILTVQSMCISEAVIFSRNCPSLSLMDRLELSDKYNLSDLQVGCLKRIHRRSAPELKDFMDENRQKIRKLSKSTIDNLPRSMDNQSFSYVAKMKEEANAGGVYEDSSNYCYRDTELLIQNETEEFEVHGYDWLLKYNVCRESDSTLVKVSADFKSRYRFSDKAKLEVTVKAVDKTITEKFDLEKDTDQCFNVNLTKNGFSEVEDKDIKVTCTVKVTDVNYTADFHGTWSIFTFSGRPHDVVLVVGEKKFYLQKVYLATWSRYFNALFYGDFAEKDKKEIKIEDVDSTEFETLMKVIHPDMKTRIHDSNVRYLLKLADRFDMPSVMAMCGNHLMNFENSPSLSLMKRLKLSDKYNLSHLQKSCLQKIHKRPASEFKTFLDENRRKIRKLSKSTMDNLV